MLKAFYKQIRFAAGDSSTAKLKSDATFFSIADGIVQHMFIKYLFAGDKFYDIVGKSDRPLTCVCCLQVCLQTLSLYLFHDSLSINIDTLT